MSTRILILVIALAGMYATVHAQATGPILGWTIPTSEAGNVARWQTCLDGACTDTTPTGPVIEGTKNRYRYQYPAPLPVQAHKFRVRSCNAISCTDSEDLTVTPPPKPGELEIK